MKRFLALTVFCLSFGGLAQAGEAKIDRHGCAHAAGRWGMTELIKDLSKRELARAQVSLVSVGYTYSLESLPPQHVFEVTVESGLPGWKKYSVTTDDQECGLLRASLVEEE